MNVERKQNRLMVIPIGLILKPEVFPEDDDNEDREDDFGGREVFRDSNDIEYFSEKIRSGGRIIGIKL